MLKKEQHLIHRSGWLRAAVMGANDGLISTASVMVGVAAAGTSANTVLLAGIASLTAGAMAMAAGEYVSVSSQSDLEQADLKRERAEIDDDFDGETEELAKLLEARGLSTKTAQQAANEMMAHDALDAHAREELSITEMTQASPNIAALSSGIAFSLGAGWPLLAYWIMNFLPGVPLLLVSATIGFIILATVSAIAGGADTKKSIVRVTFWGLGAMLVTGMVGHFFAILV